MMLPLGVVKNLESLSSHDVHLTDFTALRSDFCSMTFSSSRFLNAIAFAAPIP